MKMDSLKDVEKDPRFQSLLARADTHLSIHRPKDYAELKASGKPFPRQTGQLRRVC